VFIKDFTTLKKLLYLVMLGNISHHKITGGTSYRWLEA